jgi:site-specific DNA recombinase
MPRGLPESGLIYLRMSDFRDTDGLTFDVREEELRELAAGLGVTILGDARIENDVDPVTKRIKGASAYKTPRRVQTSTGQVEFRTHRPVFQSVVLELQHAGRPMVLFVGDDSRIARNERDGLDLLDAARVSGAYVVAPDEEGGARWILTHGGTPAEVSAFKDRMSDARKSSDELSAKLRRGRRRWAGKSYHGGPRPFGYRVKSGTDEHKRDLVRDETEAALIRKARDDLFRGISLRAVARDFRNSGIPTVSEQRAREEGRPGTGARWQSILVRSVLLNAAIVGKQVRNGERVDALWPEIITEDEQQRLADLLNDPTRRPSSTSNVPRWLLSGFATCGYPLSAGGICGLPLIVNGSVPGYRGLDCRGHQIRRDAAKVDAFIGSNVVIWLDEYAESDKLRPPPRPDVDVWALRHELRRLAGRREQFRKASATSDANPADVLSMLAVIDAEMMKVQDKIAAAHDEPDPLEGFRGVPARAAWDAAPVARRRQLVQRLMSAVVISPAVKRGSPVFDPTRVEIRWRPEAGSPQQLTG